MSTRTIRAARLRHGHRMMLPFRGVPTLHFVVRVERLNSHIRISARPESAQGRQFNGYTVREFAPDEEIEIVTR
jgi:hypothetical protein